jgi:phage-related protein
MSSLPTLLAKAPEIISKFANVINDNFPTILAKGVQLIGQIIMGIIRAIPTLVANIPKIITAIVDVWEAFNWLNLGKKAITWLKDGVLKMVGAVKSAGKTVLTGATDALKNLPQNLLNLGKSAVSDLGGAIRNGLSTVKSGAKSIFDGVVSTFKSLPQSMLSIGKDLVRGLWNGISDMTGWVIGKIQGFGSSVLGGIKSFFGIKSPSRVLRDQVGKNLALGMAEGLEDNADAPITAMRHVSSGVLDAAQEINGLQVERSVQSRAAASQAAAATSAGIGGKLDAILAAIERGQVIALDSKLLIGATADGYDNTLGQRRALVARGAL